jgi:hypothetical protein
MSGCSPSAASPSTIRGRPAKSTSFMTPTTRPASINGESWRRWKFPAAGSPKPGATFMTSAALLTAPPGDTSVVA